MDELNKAVVLVHYQGNYHVSKSQDWYVTKTNKRTLHVPPMCITNSYNALYYHKIVS